MSMGLIILIKTDNSSRDLLLSMRLIIIDKDNINQDKLSST